MEPPRVVCELKRDALGRVELIAAGERRWVRRVASGGRLPLSAVVARALLRRERRALLALRGLAGVPGVVEEEALRALAGLDGRTPAPREVILRSWIPGSGLHQTETLAEDYFERLLELVGALHRRGVCHNDLHKEQNLIVDPEGYPALVDFQLASVHGRPTRLFRSRVHDDLRHVAKHRRRYLRYARGRRAAPAPEKPRLARTRVAALWRRFVKPPYELLTRRLLRRRDGEARRETVGPWPRWTPAKGPRREGVRD